MQQKRGDLYYFFTAKFFYFAGISVNTINTFYTLGRWEITAMHKFCDRTKNISPTTTF